MFESYIQSQNIKKESYQSYFQKHFQKHLGGHQINCNTKVYGQEGT